MQPIVFRNSARVLASSRTTSLWKLLGSDLKLAHGTWKTSLTACSQRNFSDQSGKDVAEAPTRSLEKAIEGRVDLTTDSNINPNLDSKTSDTEKALDQKSKFTIPIEVMMPDLSEGDDNTIEVWYKKTGDVVKYNDVLCDIATQDFTFGLSVDDEHDAVMGEILVDVGKKTPDGCPICILYHPEETGDKD